MKRLLVLLCGLPALAAADFINLTFDEPDLSNARLHRPPVSDFTYLYAPVEEAFHGWRISEPFRHEIHTSFLRGLVVVDANSSVLSLYPSRHYTPPYIVRVGTEIWDNWPRSGFSLSQTGRVPEQAVSLRFMNFIGPVTVLLGGEPTPPKQVWGDLFEVDVSPYAGLEVELSFFFPAGTSSRLDILGFVISEPGPSAWAPQEEAPPEEGSHPPPTGGSRSPDGDQGQAKPD